MAYTAQRSITFPIIYMYRRRRNHWSRGHIIRCSINLLDIYEYEAHSKRLLRLYFKDLEMWSISLCDKMMESDFPCNNNLIDMIANTFSFFFFFYENSMPLQCNSFCVDLIETSRPYRYRAAILGLSGDFRPTE